MGGLRLRENSVVRRGEGQVCLLTLPRQPFGCLGGTGVSYAAPPIASIVSVRGLLARPHLSQRGAGGRGRSLRKRIRIQNSGANQIVCLKANRRMSFRIHAAEGRLGQVQYWWQACALVISSFSNPCARARKNTLSLSRAFGCRHASSRPISLSLCN